MEDIELIFPGGEDMYDQAIEMLSETDWALPLKALSEGTKK